MINWFDMPEEGLSNGGQFEIKELTATENKVYQKDGEVYNKVTVNVEGGGGSSDFSTAEMVFDNSYGTATYISGTFVDPEYDEIVTEVDIDAGDTVTIPVVLYKGSMICSIGDGYIVAGNASYDSESQNWIITGDCNVTVKVYNVTINSVPCDDITLSFWPSVNGYSYDYRPIINGEPSSESSIEIDLTNGVTNRLVQIAAIIPSDNHPYSVYMLQATENTPVTTGDIEFVFDDFWYFYITGNGTITIS